jgi:cytochrome c oxidase subunit 1
VHSLDELWHRKYAETHGGRVVPVPAGGSGELEHDGALPAADGHGGHGIHMPGPSYYPVIAALGLPILAYGLIFNFWLAGLGVVVVLAGIYGWILEPSAE